MISYLHLRQLAVLPDDGTGGNMDQIKLHPAGLCNTNDGLNGSIEVTIQISEGVAGDIVTLYLQNDAGEELDRVEVGSSGYRHTFEGYPDGNYKLGAFTANAQAQATLYLSCYKAPDQPADTIGSDEILLEKIYANPTYEGTDPNDPRARGWIRYEVRVWKFVKSTERHYMTSGTFRHATNELPPQDWITTNPFYGYCVPNSTTRKDFYYYHEGKVEVKLDEKSAVCGFVAVRGCTDPAATNYNPAATEDDGTCYFRPQVFGCTDPNADNYNPSATDDDGTCTYAPPIRNAVLSASIMNSVRFVAAENLDGCLTLQTLDNTLFCQEKHRGIRNVGYLQKVARCDSHIYQFRSNYESLTLNVRREKDNSVVDTIAPAVAIQNVGLSGTFAVYLKNNTNGQTRVYFNTADIPMPVTVGDMIIITGHVDSDGTYAIKEIKQDVQAQTPYLVINKPYTASEATTPASLKFQMSNAEYDVVEATVNWGAYPSGRYFVTLEATDSQFGDAVYASEPLLLRDEHPDTILIEYRNYDNAFDMIYTTGIINRVRVEGELRQRVPGGEHIVHREPQNKLTRLLGIPYRNVRLTTWKLPAWLHEKLSVIVAHDEVNLNGVQFQSLEGYEEPKYNNSVALYDGSAMMEQVEWFKEHNDHDLGSINQQPLLIVNGGFLRL